MKLEKGEKGGKGVFCWNDGGGCEGDLKNDEREGKGLKYLSYVDR